MKGKKSRQKLKLSVPRPSGNIHYGTQLSSFAEKIVTDATNKGIGQIHISSGKVKILSETIESDKIIVKVPSNAQSTFLRDYINKSSSNENPFHVEVTHSTDVSRIVLRGLKSAGSNGVGTVKKRGKKPTERIAGSSAGGDGTGGRHGMMTPRSRGSGDGTGGRHGKTPPRPKF